MANRLEIIKQKLTEAFQPEQIEVIDDSAEHVGHVGAAGGMGHYTVQIIAKAFEGKTMVQRHQMVYQALGEMMKTDIHALRIQASPPKA